MRRQLCKSVDRLDLFARDVGEWIEFQPGAVLLDDSYRGAEATLKPLAPVDPAAKRRQGARQRLHFADAAGSVGIGEPQFALRILARQRLFERLDRTDIAQAELRDQDVAIGESFLEQPSG